MLGKPDMRQQCHLAIDALPESALGEALESLRAIAEEHEAIAGNAELELLLPPIEELMKLARPICPRPERYGVEP